MARGGKKKGAGCGWCVRARRRRGAAAVAPRRARRRRRRPPAAAGGAGGGGRRPAGRRAAAAAGAPPARRHICRWKRHLTMARKSVLQKFTAALGRAMDRSDDRVRVWQDLLFNAALFSTAVWAM